MNRDGGVQAVKKAGGRPGIVALLRVIEPASQPPDSVSNCTTTGRNVVAFPIEEVRYILMAHEFAPDINLLR